jgi:hypothetical protein
MIYNSSFYYLAQNDVVYVGLKPKSQRIGYRSKYEFDFFSPLFWLP